MIDSWRWFVAGRYAFSGRSHQLVSFMSRISVAGLVLGVAVLVLVLSVVNGFERELRERVLGVVPHAVLYSHDRDVDWQAVRARIMQHESVIGSAPVTEGSGLVIVAGEPRGVTIAGIDPDLEAQVSVLPDYVVAGSLALVEGRFDVVIGAAMARDLGATVGDTLVLVLPDIRFSLAGPIPRQKRLRVSGIFATGSDVDKSQVYLHIVDANRLLRRARADGLRLQFDDLFNAPEVVQELVLGNPGDNLYGLSWLRRYGNLYDAIVLQKTTMFVLLSMLVGVAAFNVVSNMVLTVRDKQGDIAILRTLGADPGAVRAIFFMHGMLVGVMGVAGGLVLGVVAALSATSLYRAVDGWFSLGLMQQYFIQYLPAEILVADLVIVALVSLVICAIAAVYPANRAAATDPVEVLRHDI